jgi:hypothetical protein
VLSFGDFEDVQKAVTVSKIRKELLEKERG